MRKSYLLVWSLALLSLLLTFRATAVESKSYALEGAVFYFEHAGGPFEVSLQANHPGVNSAKKQVTPALLATLYDPEGHPLEDVYWYDENDAKRFEWTRRIEDAQSGFWELRISVSRACGIQYQVKSSPNPEYAFLASRCWIWHRDTLNFAKSWFMVPEDQQKPLEVFSKNVTVRVASLDGKELLNFANGSNKLQLTAGEVYQLELSTQWPGWNWSGIGGMPVIYCPNPELARRLEAGRCRGPNGQLLPLGFQKRFLEWRETLKGTNLNIELVDLENLKEVFLAHPESRALLTTTGSLAALEFLLSSQNLDESKPDYGSARYDMGALAFLYRLDKPYNPYFRHPALLKRISLACLYKLALGPLAYYYPMKENGTGQEISSNYAGGDAMVMVSDAVVFDLLKEDLDTELHALWSEALGYPLRRLFNVRESCENQTAHMPVKLWLYGRAAEKPLFQEIARNFIRDMANIERNPFLRTGYLQESYGSDATYQGLSNSLLAFYAYFSKDPEADRLLDTLFTFLNHTVVPEPDGSIFGASGFSHRTMGGWYIGQYGGGTRLVADRLSSAACRHQDVSPPFTEEECDQLLKWIRKHALSYYKNMPHVAVSYSFAPYAAIWYEIPKVPVLPGAQLPVIEKDSFRRQFGDEFLFVRQPSYYSGHYYGRSSCRSVHFVKNPPLNSTWQEKEGVWKPAGRDIFTPLQGPQLFWTPQYGSALVSMNWNLFTHWTVRLEENGQYDWVDYWKGSQEYDEKGDTLTYQQEFQKHAMQLKRIVHFGNEALTMSLALSATLESCTAFEQFPWPLRKDTRMEFQQGGEWVPTATAQITALRWINAVGNGVLAKFDRPVTVRPGKTFQDQGKNIATLDVVIPADGKLNYVLSGF